jgi:predicted phosphodiesterase
LKIAIFSDVHGNLPALETFVARTKPIVDCYLCLGDVVDYGPWNDECLEIVCSLPGIHYLEGNHEKLFLGKISLGEENPLIRDFYRSSIRNFNRYDLILNLPASLQLDSFTCSHTIGNKYIYPDTPIVVKGDYIIGHSHHQFRISRSGKEIINCGSIGQNRKWIDAINYALLDTSSSEITLYEGQYPIDALIKEMQLQGYPQNCIDYYLNKPRKYE